MPTITITLSSSVSSVSWYLSNGQSGTITSGTRSWTRNATTDYLYLEATPASGYTTPVYFYRTQPTSYTQDLGDDPYIYFTTDKAGTIGATYKPAPTYTLTYNGNGSDGGTTAPQSGGSTYTIRSCGFTKTGYTFDYWQTASGTKYYPGNSITISSNTTLYAHWTANTYTISYNANGGSGAPGNQTKYYGTTLTLSSTRPTWASHNFVGWSTNSARNASVEYLAGGSYTANAAATLYAVWDCTLAFYSKGTLSSSQYARIGGRITLPSLYDTATETFEGWLGDDGETYQAGTELTVMQSHDFNAIWRQITYTITYNGNNETGGSTTNQSSRVTYTIQECGFYKTGYVFVYWRTASGTRYYPGDSVTPTGNMTLYAQWEAKTYFYWHGSDASDATYFAVGQRIDRAVTAESWNRLCAFINTVRGYAGMSTISFATVSPGDEITSVRFNIVSNAIRQIINAGYGSITPPNVNGGQEISTSQFNGASGLKAAINSCMSEL